MKAAWLMAYNKTDLRLTVGEQKKPDVGNHDVLIRVRTAAVNPLDNMITRGEVKMIVGYKLPVIMGNECAGIIEATGPAVTKFHPGERVYARLPLDRIGAFAEYAAIHEDALALVPPYLSDEEAAAVPLTALTAMQALELMDAQAGKTIFISGGTGSFGAMAIPIAKAKGLTVITNGSGKNEERVRALGADQFIDYKKEDYMKVLADVDYVIDSLGGAELEKQFRILRRGGRLVSLRGMPNGRFAARSQMPLSKRILFGAAGRKYDGIAKKNGQTYDFIFVHADGSQLAEASDILAKQEIRPSIDGVYSLDEINNALEKISKGGSQGKTIVQIA